MFKEPNFNNPQVNQKEESVFRNQENLIFFFRKLQNVYEERPEINEFVGAMAGTKFAGDYSEEKIKEDEKYVEETRRKIDEHNSSKGQEKLDSFEENFAFAEAAQAMITDRLNNWLPDFKTIMTSDFDDLRVGVDMIMKHNSGGYLGLAFDATVSSKSETINKKLENNWEKNVARGNVPVVKYFKDPDTKQMGRLLVPKFIVGASAKDVNEIAKAYLADNEKSLDYHPFRLSALEQIETQIEGALAFYEKTDEPRYDFAKQQYLKIKEIIDKEKEKLVESKIIDRLDYHEYQKESMVINLMEEFFAKKDLNF